VDALLGTGLTRTLREPVLGLVRYLNEQPAPVAALDVPTGLHSDTGAVLGDAVSAALTVTMGAAKGGLFLQDGPGRAGRVVTVEIGIPGFAIERALREQGGALRTTDAAVQAWLPHRTHEAHKYSVGLALVVAGSPGLTGAPAMASAAAARSGAGAVVCACPESIQPTLAGKLTEVMTLALPEGDDGLDADRALEVLAPRLAQARALLLGCGLGRARGTQDFIRRLLAQTDLPVVLDADGLNALAGHTDLLDRHADGRWILTPHAGEFKRLAGEDVDLSDRVRVARDHARRWNVHLVLKGMPSLVATPDGTVYLNGTGNPALATAGTGDILAGFCAGLLAQGLTPEAAAVCGLHLGGAAADRYAEHYGPRSMVATDLLDQLPLVLAERFR
jgi:NAD(P)H-hydrate epimerase